MQRAEINEYLNEFIAVLKQYQFHLPAFAHYDLNDWQQQSAKSIAYVAQNNLGWDITDFNLGAFEKTGLSLFTVRNNTQTTEPPYAEKILYVRNDQVTPMHYHIHKIEDIINRNGAKLVVQFYHSEGKALDTDKDVHIYKDNQNIHLKAGGKIILNPGKSVRIPRFVYHSFWAEGGDVLAGEVSMTNDDNRDNIFLQPLGRFSEITEDAPPLRLLCNEYNNWIK